MTFLSGRLVFGWFQDIAVALVGVGGGQLLAGVEECLHVHKQTGSFPRLVCLCGFIFIFSGPLRVNTQQETTGLLIAFADQLINPAGMNTGACVRRLCTSAPAFPLPPP